MPAFFGMNNNPTTGGPPRPPSPEEENLFSQSLALATTLPFQQVGYMIGIPPKTPFSAFLCPFHPVPRINANSSTADKLRPGNRSPQHTKSSEIDARNDYAK